MAGLDGRVVTWGQGERIAHTKTLASIGITLVTKTQIEKRGYTLKRGQKPVVNAYFGAPIQAYAELYVLEIQCSKLEKVKQ